MQFVKLLKNHEVFYEIVKDRAAFILLSVIAFRAKHKNCNITGLKVGEAIVSDYHNYGLSRQEYRSALERLIGYGFIAKVDNLTNHKPTTVATTSQPQYQPVKQPAFIKRATTVKLSNSLLFEVYREDNSLANISKPETKEPAPQPLNNHKPTTVATINKDSRLKTKDINKKTVSKETLKSIEIKNNDNGYSKEFEEFWQIYPKRETDSKTYAFKTYQKVSKGKDFDFDKLILSVNNYCKLIDDRTFAKGAAVFLNQKMWLEEPLISGVITTVKPVKPNNKAEFTLNKPRYVFNIYRKYKDNPSTVEACIAQGLGRHVPFEKIKEYCERLNKENVVWQ